MTTRRQFIKGAVAAAVAASLPGGDGVALDSMAHPRNQLQTAADLCEASLEDMIVELNRDGRAVAYRLAWSMKQTKERVVANVLNKAFIEDPTEWRLSTPFDLSSVIDDDG